ncbi:cytochrome c oxidase subunit II [Streptomyces sp. 891-h]|uniref:cytochrome c oxidase subunit II n=1 Tax=unclassified Streptomyces TaxID=2593676 RepID=UPI001FAA0E12|nr:cytochrome c oxidase subunit II [Streptomyces sp. 891-h]
MEQRRIFEQVFTTESAIAGFVFLVVLCALAYSLVRRRAGAGVLPSPHAERQRLETLYLVVLAAVAAFLVVYTASANDREHPGAHAHGGGRAAGKARPVTVDVTAFQWCWKFAHPTPGTPRAGTASTTANCRNGHLPTLVVPTGRTVRLRITSRDVIHSLWVPALRYKMDAFPDHTNSFTLKIDEEGKWIGRCAEFCGDRHHSMDFWLKAVSPDEYENWVQQHQQAAPTGAAA